MPLWFCLFVFGVFCTVFKGSLAGVDTNSQAFPSACWWLHWQNLDFQTVGKDTTNHFPASLPQSNRNLCFFKSHSCVRKKKEKSPSSNATLSSFFIPPPTAKRDPNTFHVIGYYRLLVFIFTKILLTSVSFDISRLKSLLRLLFYRINKYCVY